MLAGDQPVDSLKSATDLLRLSKEIPVPHVPGCDVESTALDHFRFLDIGRGENYMVAALVSRLNAIVSNGAVCRYRQCAGTISRVDSLPPYAEPNVTVNHNEASTRRRWRNLARLLSYWWLQLLCSLILSLLRALPLCLGLLLCEDLSLPFYLGLPARVSLPGRLGLLLLRLHLLLLIVTLIVLNRGAQTRYFGSVRVGFRHFACECGGNREVLGIPVFLDLPHGGVENRLLQARSLRIAGSLCLFGPIKRTIAARPE